MRILKKKTFNYVKHFVFCIFIYSNSFDNADYNNMKMVFSHPIIIHCLSLRHIYKYIIFILSGFVRYTSQVI